MQTDKKQPAQLKNTIKAVLSVKENTSPHQNQAVQAATETSVHIHQKILLLNML